MRREAELGDDRADRLVGHEHRHLRPLPIRQAASTYRKTASIKEGSGHMLNLIGAAISGLVVGALARWIYWGPVPMNLFATMLLGVAGSLAAGWVTTRGRDGIQPAGCLASVLGAVVLIFLGRMLGIG
jgi:uncharacterized membrane protein YeaQ/YmgE (transglycosylase-associated protein family)